MRIAIAQINSTVGGFDENVRNIARFVEQAAAEKADIVFFPELALCGYPPMDLLDQDAFVENNIRALRLLQRTLPPGIAVGLGYVQRNRANSGKSLVNAYGIVQDGALLFEQTKTLLPTYDVFDEARNFEPAKEWPHCAFSGEKIGVAICEDVWRETETPGTRYHEDPVRRLLDTGLTILAVPSASPYYAGKMTERLALAERIARRGSLPLVYINAVGANDSIIFDGRSFILTPDGIAAQAPAFAESLIVWDSVSPSIQGGEASPLAPDHAPVVPPSTRSYATPLSGGPAPRNAPHPDSTLRIEHRATPCDLDIIEGALVMGIREYMRKCGFKRTHLGLSGGIDSALVAYLAVEAAGKENVATFSMPSMFSSPGSKDDAADLAKNLGCRYETLPIEHIYNAFTRELAPVFEDKPFNVAEENLQARIRGGLMMAFSNKFDSMLMNTGNKSELAMGYCTLYGDMNGALSPIGDLFKTEVFALCRRINEKAGSPLIPEAILTKAPSAELRPNQKDEDTLPPYDILDEILRLYLFENRSADEIAAHGYDRDLAAWIIKTCARAEFKRRQAPPVLKVSPRAFGMGRRMPIARAIYEA
ncbi:MAG: NAD+ synthase [Spirochaetaceae bacterium]|jgi:NAD+ synthase (glutamine-hydrolysing)|nr:NAD+ synthase [Spirochaetaceae bacterium]